MCRGAGVRDWHLLFPGSCHIRGGRPGGSRFGRSPATMAAAEASWRRLAGCPVIRRRGREPGVRARASGCAGPSLCPGVIPVRAVPLAALIPPRVSGRGKAHGAGPRQGRPSGGSIKRAPAPPYEGGGQTQTRPRGGGNAGVGPARADARDGNPAARPTASAHRTPDLTRRSRHRSCSRSSAGCGDRPARGGAGHIPAGQAIAGQVRGGPCCAGVSPARMRTPRR